jgi:HK97 family phage prohead protease
MTDQTHTRTVDFELIRSEGDGLTLRGYAAVFNTPTEISDWKGTYTEQMGPTAFDRAIRQNPRPVMQFDHGQHPLLGSIPIGVYTTMRADTGKGLYLEGPVHNNWLTEPVRDAINSGAISGMSIRFSVPDGGEDFDPATNTRTINDLVLYEAGPVVFPAYTTTSVSLRSQQLAEALENPEARHDLAYALLMTGTDTRNDSDEASIVEDVEPVIEDPPVVVDTDTADPDTVSAPNTAARHATLYAVKTERALRRS